MRDIMEVIVVGTWAGVLAGWIILFIANAMGSQ